MKLKEILEANMYTVDHSDPSGVGVPTSVDPDEVDEMIDPKGTRYSKVGDEHRADRSKRLRKRMRVAKNMKSPAKQRGRVVGDNNDMTGSGANSTVNGPYNY